MVSFLSSKREKERESSCVRSLPSFTGYLPDMDTSRLRGATKGFGTDEATIISVLAPLSPLQMHSLRRAYEANVGRSLMKTLEKETRGWFEWALRGLVLGPLGFDVWLLNHSMKGIGSNEE